MLVSEIISRIRADLDDTANITSAATTSVISSVRAKLGDPADSALGTTTASSVSAESVIHYAQWSTSGSVTGTNSNINSTVQIAAGSGSLSGYAEDGIKTIKGMRPDTLINGSLPGGFQNALNIYVLARCLEGEVETEVGSSGYRTFYEIFEKEVASVPAHISDAALTGFFNLGITEITTRRPDLGTVICAATLSLLEDFVMAQASQSKLGTAAHPNLTAFYSILDSIPYHWSDAELLKLIHDSIRDIIRLRSDARMDDSGYEIDIDTDPAATDEYPLRESFAKASEWFSAAGAIFCRIGADQGADAKYQQWMNRYNEEIRGAK
jgi:hypothetical protein